MAQAGLAAGGGALALLGLQGLLVGTHGGKRVLVADVGDRVVRALLAEVAGRLTPAVRLNPKLLAEQGDRDLRLVGAEARQLGKSAAELGGVNGCRPHRARVTVV